MYKLILAGLMASLPLTTLAAPAATTTAATLTTKLPKSCACYTATVTTTPEICPLCLPLSCSIPTTITTTIPGPNPTCSTTDTTTVTRDCVCNGNDGCWTAWETKTGKFTCKRGGTKQTSFPVPLPEPIEEPEVPASTTEEVPVATEDPVMSILPIDLGTPDLGAPTATATEVPEDEATQVYSILPIATDA